MIPLSEAQGYVLDRCRPGAVVAVPIHEARGLVLAGTVTAPEAIPPFDNSAMDGFAVRAADTADAPIELTVVATIAAGSASDRVIGVGEAARIMTGAPMPPGADAVVMVERTELVTTDRVRLDVTVEVGNHIRPAGDDLKPGDLVFESGTELSPAHLGVLAAIGTVEAVVHRRPRVGVLSTGDELVAAGEPLALGQIRDSNRLSLLATLAESGVVPVDLGLVRDDPDAISTALSDGVARCDALLSSGGVSMGDFDFVKQVLADIAEMRWMQVAIRPAKPFAFGVTAEGVPIFGLPGNPVSSLVSFELFARPGLRRMMGHTGLHRPTVPAVMPDGSPRRPDGKTHFVRVRVAREGDGFVARSAGLQGSHNLTAMAHANGLAVLPDGDGIAQGATAEVMLLSAVP